MSQRISSILAYLNQVSSEKFQKISREPIYQCNSMNIIARWSQRYDPRIRKIPYWFGLKAVDLERIQTNEIVYYAFICEDAGVIFLPIDVVLLRIENDELLKSPLEGPLLHYHVQFDDRHGVMEWYLKSGSRVNVNHNFYPILEQKKFIGDSVTTLDDFEEIQKNLLKDTKKISTDELLRRLGSEGLQKRSVISEQVVRNPIVIELAKRRANGKCQLCGDDAPFSDNDGVPFLETHHIIWLSREGEDSLNNTVALCPNCHRKMHILDLLEDIEFLKKKAMINL